MSFIRYRGKTKTVWLRKKASTAFTEGAAVVWGTAGDYGTIIPATASTTSANLQGIIKITVASTDSDYASTTKVPVEVPVDKNVEFVVDVTANTFTEANVLAKIGHEADLTDSVTLNLAASSVNVCKIKDMISTAKVVVVLKTNGSY